MHGALFTKREAADEGRAGEALRHRLGYLGHVLAHGKHAARAIHHQGARQRVGATRQTGGGRCGNQAGALHQM